MICPKCNREMVSGYIPSGKMAIIFVPHGEGKMPKTIFGTGKGTVKITKPPLWKMQKAEAYYCPTCKIVITPVKDLD